MQNLPPTPAIQFPDPKTVTYYQLFASTSRNNLCIYKQAFISSFTQRIAYKILFCPFFFI